MGRRFAFDAPLLSGHPVLDDALACKLFVITTSVGIAMWRDGENDDAELLRRADAALYEAKRRGRNGFFCEETDTLAGPLAALSESPAAVRH